MKKNKLGFALMETMLVIATVALLSAIGLSNFLKNKLAANIQDAQLALKTISAAAEVYADEHNGLYPISISHLVTPQDSGAPAYLKENYCNGKIRNSYIFGCSFNPDKTGYILTARPLSCKATGSKSFTMNTNGVLTTDTTCIAANK